MSAILIISAIALVVFIFSLDLSWSNVLSGHRNELIFEGRNHLYGAYRQRREYHRNLILALFLSVGTILAGFVGIKALRGDLNEVTRIPELAGIIVDITPVKPADTPEKQSSGPAAKPASSSEGGQSERYEVVENTQTAAQIIRPGGDDEAGGIEGPGGGTGSGGTGTGMDEGGMGGPTLEDEDEPKSWVRQMPAFPGGADAFRKYIQERVKFSEYEKQSGVSGTIYVSFVIGKYGEVSRIRIERGIRGGEGLERKIRRALEEMPLWTPGNNGSGPVPVVLSQPLVFELRP